MSYVRKICLASIVSIIPMGVFADSVLTSKSYVDNYAVKQAGWDSESQNKFLKIDDTGIVVPEAIDISSKQDNLGGTIEIKGKLVDVSGQLVTATGTPGVVDYTKKATTIDGIANSGDDAQIPTVGAVESYALPKQQSQANAGKSMVVDDSTGNVVAGYPKIPVSDSTGVIGMAEISLHFDE